MTALFTKEYITCDRRSSKSTFHHSEWCQVAGDAMRNARVWILCHTVALCTERRAGDNTLNGPLLIDQSVNRSQRLVNNASCVDGAVLRALVARRDHRNYDAYETGFPGN